MGLTVWKAGELMKISMRTSTARPTCGGGVRGEPTRRLLQEARQGGVRTYVTRNTSFSKSGFSSAGAASYLEPWLIDGSLLW